MEPEHVADEPTEGEVTPLLVAKRKRGRVSGSFNSTTIARDHQHKAGVAAGQQRAILKEKKEDG